MVALLTPSDRKTLIFLFVILTIATVIDIIQDQMNKITDDQMREEIKNNTEIIKHELNQSEIGKKELKKTHDHIDEKLSNIYGQHDEVIQKLNNITKK